MNESEILCAFLFDKLTNDSKIKAIIGKKCYPLRTKEPIDGAYIIVDQFDTLMDETKDGSFADSLTARILCVAKDHQGASSLAIAVKSLINNLFVPSLGDTIQVVSRREDAEADEYLQELQLKIDL